MSNFFVLGLPRSRTAWLANFLTFDGLFCHHEGINGCSTMSDYAEKIGKDGDSNTALAFFDIKDLFPDSKIIIIDNSIDAAVAFGRKQGNDIRESMKAEKKILDSMDGLHIDISEIDERLEEIWSYVTDKPFNKKRADMLKNFNVQVQGDWVDFGSLSNFVQSSGYIQ